MKAIIAHRIIELLEEEDLNEDQVFQLKPRYDTDDPCRSADYSSRDDGRETWKHTKKRHQRCK